MASSKTHQVSKGVSEQQNTPPAQGTKQLVKSLTAAEKKTLKDKFPKHTAFIQPPSYR